jgi:hypothetical protein
LSIEDGADEFVVKVQGKQLASGCRMQLLVAVAAAALLRVQEFKQACYESMRQIFFHSCRGSMLKHMRGASERTAEQVQPVDRKWQTWCVTVVVPQHKGSQITAKVYLLPLPQVIRDLSTKNPDVISTWSNLVHAKEGPCPQTIQISSTGATVTISCKKVSVLLRCCLVFLASRCTLAAFSHQQTV